MGVFRVGLKKVVDDSYDIQIGAGLAPALVEDLKNGLVPGVSRYAVVTDSNVAPLYGEAICDGLRAAGLAAELFTIPAGEKSKVRAVKEQLEDALLEKGFRRDSCVVAVGGGVVSDLAGFMAGTFGRGVPFLNFATTLLAAADASVGGKTAVDTPLATNLIGLIYQPKKVYIDIEAWKTLPHRQMVSGMAETIKHACMADADFFAFLEQHMDEIYAFDPTVCMHVAETNARIKYQVVMQDERETGMREILNLGHTVGRALETASGYSLFHGEAVAVGLMAQAKLGVRFGFMTQEEVDRVEALLRKAGLPVRLPEGMNVDELVRKLYTDKKVRGGRLRFVFQKGIGEMMTFGENSYARPVSEEDARAVLEALQ